MVVEGEVLALEDFLLVMVQEAAVEGEQVVLD